VLSVAETTDDPQFSTRGAVTEANHPTAGPFRQLAPLLAGMERPTSPIALPDQSVTRTADLLGAAGVDQATIEGWLARRVVA